MRKPELELRGLDILERVAKGHPIEDDTVELKAEWPQHHLKAARRIAAHATAPPALRPHSFITNPEVNL